MGAGSLSLSVRMNKTRGWRLTVVCGLPRMGRSSLSTMVSERALMATASSSVRETSVFASVRSGFSKHDFIGSTVSAMAASNRSAASLTGADREGSRPFMSNGSHMEDVRFIAVCSLGSERRRSPSDQTASSEGEVVRAWHIRGTIRCRMCCEALMDKAADVLMTDEVLTRVENR